MKRRNFIFSLMILSIVFVLALFGCNSNTISIVSIEKTQSNGLTDIYTITYSDGSEYNFEITNGKDGEDGESIDFDKIYATYIEKNPNATYEEFLKEVLNINLTSNTLSINKALRSSAKIYTEFTETYRTGYMTTANETAIYLGSSVICKVDSDYTYFITNYHVVYNTAAVEQDKIAKKIVCYLYGSEGGPSSTNTKDENNCTIYNYGNYGIDCEYVGGSLTADIAVVRASTSAVYAVNENVCAVTFAEDYCVGDTSIAIGNPEGEGISVTRGVVSVDNEYINLSIDGTSRSYRVMRIDTSIYNGSSGGGLFDVDGNLIGITNAGDGEDQNVNYAIPLEIVKSTVENILYYGGNAKKVTLGVEVVSSNSKYVFNEQKGKGEIVERVTVNKITDGSIVQQMGLQVGDILISFKVNGEEIQINRLFTIGDILYTIRSGDVIEFNLSRNGQQTTSATYTVQNSDLNVLA